MTNITPRKEESPPNGQPGRSCNPAPRPKRKPDPPPPPLAVSLQPTVVPNADGTFIIRPGRPVSRLTALQFGRCFQVTRRTVYRWIDEGLINAEYVENVGHRKILIHAEAVDSCKKKFEAGMR